MSATRCLIALGASASLIFCSAASAARYFVDGSVSSSGAGISWGTAFKTLQEALDVGLNTNDEIWVAAGTYNPNEGLASPPANLRTACFRIPRNIMLLGGFAGTETTADEALPASNITILSGDRLGNDNPADFASGTGTYSDNNYNVVGDLLSGTEGWDTSNVLDGFTIRGGNANSTGGNGFGGGLNVDSNGNPGEALVSRCIFEGNRASLGGGGAYVSFNDMRFRDCRFLFNRTGGSGGGFYAAFHGDFVQCRFEGNLAVNGGGGLYGEQRERHVVNCEFIANSAGLGGGMYELAPPRIMNSIFVDNDAVTFGGALYTADAEIINSAFVDNASTNPSGAAAGGGIWIQQAHTNPATMVYNCIVYGNTNNGTANLAAQIGTPASPANQLDVQYSDVQGIASTNGNFSAPPLFILNPSGNYRLQPTSPCIDMGSDGLVPEDYADVDNGGEVAAPNIEDPIEWDFDLSGRFVGTVDMGPFENRKDEPCTADLNADCHVDGIDLGILLSQWGGTGSADFNGDGVVNGVDLGSLLANWSGSGRSCCEEFMGGEQQSQEQEETVPDTGYIPCLMYTSLDDLLAWHELIVGQE